MKTLGIGAKIIVEVRSESVEIDGKQIDAFVVSQFNQPKMVFIPRDDVLLGQLYRPAGNQAACRCDDKLVLFSQRKWTVPFNPKVTQLIAAYEEAMMLTTKHGLLRSEK